VARCTMTGTSRVALSALAATAALLGLAALACGEGGASDLVTVRDSAGIRIITNTARPEGVASAVEDLSIGVVEGDENYMFAGVEAVAVGPGDTIYVVDGDAKQIKVYTPAGTHIRSFGREGEGPGEFLDPSLATFFGDTLVVFDRRARRLTYFGSDGTVFGMARTELPSIFVGGIDRLDDSTLVVQADMPGAGDGGQTWLLRVAFDGRVLDTLLVTDRRSYMTYRIETFIALVPLPFPRAPRWDVASDGRIAYGRGDGYQIGVYEYPPSNTDSIGHLRTLIRHADPPRTVTDEDVEAYRQSVIGDENLTLPRRRGYEEALGTMTYPTTWPAFDRLRFDALGRLWVRRPPREADSLVSWDVFDADGRLVRTVAVPKALMVHAITGDAIYGVMRDELDVQYVKRFRLPR
jgi:hypothetical protein